VSKFPNASFILSAAAPQQFPADFGSEVAFAGRSNAGKSSAINAITGRHSLARTSKTPGRTRLLNYFELAPNQRIVDLPGYGYADVPEAERRAWVPLINALRERESLRGLFLIVDSRRGLTDGDAELIEWSDPSVRDVHVLLSKADKLTRNEATQALRKAEGELQGRATVQLFSVPSKTGLDEARRVLNAWLASKTGGQSSG
jgi:GTP-binding protein